MSYRLVLNLYLISLSCGGTEILQLPVASASAVVAPCFGRSCPVLSLLKYFPSTLPVPGTIRTYVKNIPGTISIEALKQVILLSQLEKKEGQQSSEDLGG